MIGFARIHQPICLKNRVSTVLPLAIAGIFILFNSSLRVVAQTPPNLNLQLIGGNPRLSLSGQAGSPCTVQYATNLSGGWVSFSNVTFFSNSFLLVDSAGVTTNARFYRT